MRRRKFLQAAAAAVGISPLYAAPTLTNRRAEAQPITVAERRERMARAQALMAQSKIDAVVLTPGTSLQYFTGIRTWNSERMIAMVLPRKGEPFFVSPAFEEGRVREMIAAGLGPERFQVVVWQEDQSPYERTAFGLRERGVTTGQVGIEETVKFVFADGLAKALPATHITSATAVTAGCRMIKSRHELDLMRLANQVTLAAYEWAWRQLKDGMTQHEFGALVRQGHQMQGFEGDASVQVGTYSALPHGSREPQKVREGTILLIDGGCSVSVRARTS